MAKISLAELSTRVCGETISDLVANVVADDDPWLFRANPGTYQAFTAYLCEQLNDPEETATSTSQFCRLGYSMSSGR